MLQDRRILVGFSMTLLVGLILIAILPGRSSGEAAVIVTVAGFLLGFAQLMLIRSGFGVNVAFSEAQQNYLRGDFDAVIDGLEAYHAELESVGEPVPSDTLTLLGNTYRQVAELDKSLELLAVAVERDPEDPFPRYGYGRSLLAAGNFDEAYAEIDQSLKDGARKVVRAEWFLARYFSISDVQVLLEAGQKTARLLRLEAHRKLMVNYLLHQLYQQLEDASQTQLDIAERLVKVNAGSITYWEAERDRFADTPYGQRLVDEVESMKALIEA